MERSYKVKVRRPYKGRKNSESEKEKLKETDSLYKESAEIVELPRYSELEIQSKRLNRQLLLKTMKKSYNKRNSFAENKSV